MPALACTPASLHMTSKRSHGRIAMRGFATSRGWTNTLEVKSAPGASARELGRPRRRDIDVVVVCRLE